MCLDDNAKKSLNFLLIIMMISLFISLALILFCTSTYGLKIVSAGHQLGKCTRHRASVEESLQPTRPKWASGGVISDAVNFLISIKPLFNIMKAAARNVLIGTAEKNGINWKQNSAFLESERSTLEEYFRSLEKKDMKYPSYYVQGFHAYDEGRS